MNQDPMSHEAQEAIWSEHAGDYSSGPSGLGMSLSALEIHHALTQLIKNRQDSLPLMDMGCFTGVRLSLLEPCKRGLMMGLDLSFQALKVFQSKCGSRAFPAQSDAELLPLISESVNTVLLLDILEHLPHPVSCLKEVYRTLKPGGQVLIHLPIQDNSFSFYSLQQKFSPQKAKQIYDQLGHDYDSMWTVQELLQHAEDLNLQVIKYWRYDALLQPLWDFHFRKIVYNLVGDRIYGEGLLQRISFALIRLLTSPDRILAKLGIGNTVFVLLRKTGR